MDARQSSKRHMLLFLPETFSDKPRIKIPIQVVRTVPGHILWCSSEGTPPINMTILQDSILLDNGTGITTTIAVKNGNVTCVAENQAGAASKAFPVTLKGP